MAKTLPIGVPVANLRPTQMTVGFREVDIKRRQWRDADDEARVRLLRSHVVPAVLGPKRPVLHRRPSPLQQSAVGGEAEADRGLRRRRPPAHLAKKEFWTFLDNSDWCHAYDADGKRRGLSDIPNRLTELHRDDPFPGAWSRELIRAGGCAKTSAPVLRDFLWPPTSCGARIKRSLIEKDFGSALVAALRFRQGHGRQEPPRLVGLRSLVDKPAIGPWWLRPWSTRPIRRQA